MKGISDTRSNKTFIQNRKKLIFITYNPQNGNLMNLWLPFCNIIQNPTQMGPQRALLTVK